MDNLEDNKGKILYPKTGMAKRIVSGSFLNILGQVIGALKHIILVPLFLRVWGSIVYGEWLTIYALVAYLPLVDIGMQNYIINSLTQACSKGNLKEYARIFQSALRLCLIIVALFSLFFLVFVFLVPFNKWFNIIVTDSFDVKLTAFILGVYLLFGILSGLIIGLYQSFGEYPRRAMFSNIKEILLISFLAIALLLKSNFIVVSSLHFIPLFILVSYCIWDINHRHKEKVQFGFFSADWKLSFSFIGPGLLFLMIILANALKIQGSILVISASLGSWAVSIFSIHRTLANLIFKIIGSINCALWPELTATEARKDYNSMRLAFNFIIKFSLFLSFTFAIILFFIGKDIIRIWTQNRIEFQPILWLLFLIYIPINSFWETCGIFQISTNRHKKYALARISSAILGLGLAIILTKIWGIIGALAGFIIVEFIICGGVIPFETLKIIKADKNNFWLSLLGKGFLFFSLQIFIALIFRKLFFHGIFCGFIFLIIILSTGGVCSYFYWLDKEEKKILINLLKTFYRKWCKGKS